MPTMPSMPMPGCLMHGTGTNTVWDVPRGTVVLPPDWNLVPQSGPEKCPPHDHLLGITTHAYHVGMHGEGRRAAAWLDRVDTLPEIDAAARRNRTWYTLPFCGASAQLTLSRPHAPGWNPLNPTICFNGDTLVAVVRECNYRLDGHTYLMLDDSGPAPEWRPDAPLRNAATLVLATKPPNWIRDGRDAFVAVGRSLLEIGLPEPAYERSGVAIHGPEDYRILRLADGSYQLSATVVDSASPGTAGIARIGVCRWTPGAAEPMSPMVVPPEPFHGRNEKNWAPMEGMENTFLYAASEEGHAATVRLVDGVWRVAKHAPAPPIARHLRGSSQLLRVPEGWLAVVHESIDCKEGRIYEHRIVLWDTDLRMLGITEPFRLSGKRGVEFCGGAAIRFGDDPAGDRLFVSYGVDDSSCWVASISMDLVYGQLRNPLVPMQAGLTWMGDEAVGWGRRAVRGDPLRRGAPTGPPRAGWVVSASGGG